MFIKDFIIASVIGATSTGAPVMRSQNSTSSTMQASEETTPSFFPVRSVAVSKLLKVCVCVSFYVASLFARSGFEQLFVQIHSR